MVSVLGPVARAFWERVLERAEASGQQVAASERLVQQVEALARQVEVLASVPLVAKEGCSASPFSVCRRRWLNWSTMP